MEKERDLVEDLSPGEKRWYVTGIYQASCQIFLEKKGIQFPTDGEIADFVKRVKRSPLDWMRLEHLAGKIRGIEFGQIRQDLKSQYPNMPETYISRRCLAEIERRYLEIDQDSDRNDAFLDAIIFAEDK